MSYISDNKSNIYSILALLGAFFIGIQNFSYTEKVFFLFDTTHNVCLSPTFFSAIASIFIVYPVFSKGKADITNNHSMINIFLLVLDISVVATFTSTLFTADNLIPGIPLNGYTLLISGIVLSWLGIRSISKFIWIILIICSLTRMTKVDNAMGFLGFVYVVLTFLGIMFQVKYVCGNKEAITDEYKNTANNYAQTIKEDILNNKH